MVHSNGLVDNEDRGFAGCPSQKNFRSSADASRQLIPLRSGD